MTFPNKQYPYTLNELYEVIHGAGATVIESNMMTQLPKQNTKPQPATFRVIVEVTHNHALYRIEGNFAGERYIITRIIELSCGEYGAG